MKLIQADTILAQLDNREWTSCILLLVLSILIGLLLAYLDIRLDIITVLQLRVGTLLLSVLISTATVRVSGGLSWSLLNGYAITFPYSLYAWVDDYDIVLGDLPDPEYLEHIVWYLGGDARALIPAASVGFILGAVWTYKHDLSRQTRWITVRSLIAISLSVVVWLLWKYVINTPLFAPGY